MEFLIIILIGCILGLVFTEVVDIIENKYIKGYMNEIIEEIQEQEAQW